MAARHMEDAEAAFDLLALCEGDLGEKILSYASASDLCALDAVGGRWQRLTADPWRTVTMGRFGMQNGKEGWKVGTSFLRKPTFIHPRDEGDFGYGDSYMGSASVASNGSIIAAVADDVQDNTDDRTFPDEENGIGIRDAFTLNYIRTAPYTAILTQTIETGNLRIGNTALADEYIVASEGKMINVWSRSSGKKVHKDLFDEDPEDNVRDPRPVSMSCHGHLLVSTSRIGCALCIWNIKTGKLLKRYNHASDECHVDMLPGDSTPTI
ncbi:hypothetical protein ACHAXT_012013 [Thalassiosira profunda]